MLHVLLHMAEHDGPTTSEMLAQAMQTNPAVIRRIMAAEIHRRLVPGAPLVAVHASFPQDAPGRTTWLSRYAAYAVASGDDPTAAEMARTAVGASLNLFGPKQDAAI